VLCAQVRFDDTNPTKEKDEYVENIIKDMQTLGLKYKEITYTSDYFPQVRGCCPQKPQGLPLFACLVALLGCQPEGCG
jgi:hypothetical protein